MSGILIFEWCLDTKIERLFIVRRPANRFDIQIVLNPKLLTPIELLTPNPIILSIISNHESKQPISI